MVGLILIASMIFTAFVVYKLTPNKIMKYILPVIIAPLYGFLLFFVGMGINIVLFFVLALLPAIITVFYIIK